MIMRVMFGRWAALGHRLRAEAVEHRLMTQGLRRVRTKHYRWTGVTVIRAWTR